MSARRHLGEILSAFEFLDSQALAMTLEQLPNNVQDPLPGTEACAPSYSTLRKTLASRTVLHASDSCRQSSCRTLSPMPSRALLCEACRRSGGASALAAHCHVERVCWRAWSHVTS